MHNNDAAFRSAQRDWETPPDEPDYTCPDCDGSGTVDFGNGEDVICPRCKGHGSLDGIVADEEVSSRADQAEEEPDDI